MYLYCVTCECGSRSKCFYSVLHVCVAGEASVSIVCYMCMWQEKQVFL